MTPEQAAELIKLVENINWASVLIAIFLLALLVLRLLAIFVAKER